MVCGKLKFIFFHMILYTEILTAHVRLGANHAQKRKTSKNSRAVSNHGREVWFAPEKSLCGVLIYMNTQIQSSMVVVFA